MREISSAAICIIEIEEGGVTAVALTAKEDPQRAAQKLQMKVDRDGVQKRGHLCSNSAIS